MATTITSPRIGHFPTALVSWSDGTLFTGFALCALIPPVGYSEVDSGLQDPAETLPQFAVIPIVNGSFNSSLGLYYSADLNPPGMTYNISFYTTTKKLIAGPSVAFSVTADPITTITIPTLTVPVAGGTP